MTSPIAERCPRAMPQNAAADGAAARLMQIKDLLRRLAIFISPHVESRSNAKQPSACARRSQALIRSSERY
jgi:hypothetical protein